MPAVLTAKQAAAYVGVGLTHFKAHVRPHVPVVDMKPPKSRRPMWRWRPEHLDHYLTQRERTIP